MDKVNNILNKKIKFHKTPRKKKQNKYDDEEKNQKEWQIKEAKASDLLP